MSPLREIVYIPKLTDPVFYLHFPCRRCSGQDGIPPERYVYIPKLWIWLYLEKDLWDGIKLRISRWEHPGLFKWLLNSLTSVLIRDGKDKTQKRRQASEDRDGHWSNAAQQARDLLASPEAGRDKEGKHSRVSWGVRPADTCFWFLVSRSAREHFSVALSHPVCGNLVWQLQKANTKG